MIVSAFFISCDKSADQSELKLLNQTSGIPDKKSNQLPLDTVKLVRQLSMDPSFLEIVRIKDQLSELLFLGKKPTKEVVDAYLLNDIKRLRSFYGLPDSEMDGILHRLELARASIYERYPDIKSHIESNQQCIPCEASKDKNTLIARIETINKKYQSPELNFMLKSSNSGAVLTEEYPGCSYLYYLCLIAATFCLEGYPFCAWLCVCTYCDKESVMYQLFCIHLE